MTGSFDAAIKSRPVPERVYRLVDGTACVERSGFTVLVAPKTGRAVRVTSVAHNLMGPLRRGAPFDELLRHLQSKYPGTRDVSEKLGRFLEQLEKVGLIDGVQANGRPPGPRRITLIHPDPFVNRVAQIILKVPSWLRSALLVLALCVAAAGMASAVLDGRLPHPHELFTEFDAFGLLAFLLVVVPLHEAAHAVACRVAGAPVGGAGLTLTGALPGPYVDTTRAYAIQDRRKRFFIPAAGPIVNFLSAGTAAWVLAKAPADGAVVHAAATTFIIAAFFVYFDTNPLTPSDGSHMIEALLDDEFAREAAIKSRYRRMSTSRDILIYRLVSAAHGLLSFSAIGWWWNHASF